MPIDSNLPTPTSMDMAPPDALFVTASEGDHDDNAIEDSHPGNDGSRLIALTDSTDPELNREVLELNAIDFLNKPIEVSDLIPRVRNALFIKSHFDQLANEAAKLEEQVAHRTAELLVWSARAQLSLWYPRSQTPLARKVRKWKLRFRTP